MIKLLAKNVSLMDAIACLVLHGSQTDKDDMENWIKKSLTLIQFSGLIEDFYTTHIESRHQWVFRTLIYTMDIYTSWLIFSKMEKVGDSHWLISYKIAEIPKASNYIYPQEILDFINSSVVDRKEGEDK